MMRDNLPAAPGRGAAAAALIYLPLHAAVLPWLLPRLFTGLGAGIWVAILAGVGYYFGRISGDIGYADLIKRCSEAINRHYIWILAGLVLFVVVYLYCHKKIMASNLSGKI